MTSNTLPISNKDKDLHQRLILLEKFIELKSNECAYYRTKVHLMQISSVNSQLIKNKPLSKNQQRSSSEDISQSSITSQSPSNSMNNKHRRSSVPSPGKARIKNHTLHLSNSSMPFDHAIKSKHLPLSSSIRRHRKKRNEKIYAQNQNYYEEALPHSNCKSSSPTHSPSLSKEKIEEILLSYLNKHLPQSVAHDKNIQCNAHDFHPADTSHTVLMIRLPRRFVKSLLSQQKKPTTRTPKLKVHISSELLHKLFQSIHFNSQTSKQNQFTIQSQFGPIAACINQKHSYDQQHSKAIHAKAEVKTHPEGRLSIIRHIVRTRSNGSDRKKILIEKNRHPNSHQHRRKKRHLHKSNRTSEEESKRSSLTNVTQSGETLSSSDQTSNSISIENNKIHRNR